MESSRRNLLNDMAEHRPILKNIKLICKNIKISPSLWLLTKNRYGIPQNEVWFLVCNVIQMVRKCDSRR